MIKRLGVGVFALLVVAGGVTAWHVMDVQQPAQAADSDDSNRVPVKTAQTQVKDVPVLLDGLGTVQALNVVQIKAQVNGALIALPVKEGQEVHKGDIVAEIDPRAYKAALDQAQAQRDEDAALLQSATLDLHRYQDLAKRNFASIQQVDDQQATVNKDQAAVALDNASIETAQINLDYCVIRAPIDGRVSFYQVDVGNIIMASSQTSGIVSITQDKPITVILSLPEADLLRIQQAQAAGPVPVLAYNSQDAKSLLATGTLLTPNNTIDTTTGTVSLKAVFDNADDHLWPGEFVNGRVRVGVLRNAVTAPVDVVQHGPDGLYVYVVKPDQTVAQVDVALAYQDGGVAVISKGLTGNETLVLSGQSRLAPGTRIRATNVASSS